MGLFDERIGVIEDVGAGLIDGNCPRVGRTVGRLAGVQLQGLEAVRHRRRLGALPLF